MPIPSCKAHNNFLKDFYDNLTSEDEIDDGESIEDNDNEDDASINNSAEVDAVEPVGVSPDPNANADNLNQSIDSLVAADTVEFVGVDSERNVNADHQNQAVNSLAEVDTVEPVIDDPEANADHLNQSVDSLAGVDTAEAVSDDPEVNANADHLNQFVAETAHIEEVTSKIATDPLAISNDTAPNDPVEDNVPNCNDSEPLIDENIHESDNTIDPLRMKVESVPLYEADTRNNEEIDALLDEQDEICCEDDVTMIISKNGLPKPLAATTNDIIKRENDPISGCISFISKVSILN